MGLTLNVALALTLFGVGQAQERGTTLGDEVSDHVIDAEVSILQKMKALLHDKTEEDLSALFDHDGNGGISRMEIIQFMVQQGLVPQAQANESFIPDAYWK